MIFVVWIEKKKTDFFPFSDFMIFLFDYFQGVRDLFADERILNSVKEYKKWKRKKLWFAPFIQWKFTARISKLWLKIWLNHQQIDKKKDFIRAKGSFFHREEKRKILPEVRSWNHKKQNRWYKKFKKTVVSIEHRDQNEPNNEKQKEEVEKNEQTTHTQTHCQATQQQRQWTQNYVHTNTQRHMSTIKCAT